MKKKKGKKKKKWGRKIGRVKRYIKTKILRLINIKIDRKREDVYVWESEIEYRERNR